MTTSGSNLEFYMLDLINATRAANGLTALKLEQRLNQSAEDHSLWMLETDIFSHTGVNGSSSNTRMRDADFTFSGSWASGENLAYQSERGAAGFFDDVQDLHIALMNSAGHRANILSSNYEYVGIGIEIGNFRGLEGVIVTQNFAKTSAQVILDTGETAPAPAPAPFAAMPDFDVITGTAGRDVINGSAGADEIIGRGGNDLLRGGGGDDTIRGDNGNDWLVGGSGADELRGGRGVDIVDYHGLSSAVTADLQHENANSGGAAGDMYYSIASLRGTAQDDALRGNEWGNQLRGGSGDDILNGRGGNDTLYGGNGDDAIRGNTGNDVLYGMRGADRFVFETGMGRDVVKDFQNNVDTLDFRGMGYTSVNQLMNTASARNGDVVFDLAGADEVIIENATLSQLPDDILF